MSGRAMEHISQLVSAQRTYFLNNNTLDLGFRREQLQRLQAMLAKNQEHLQDAIYEDFKKSPFDTYISEIAMLFHDLSEAMARLKRWAATKRVKTNLLNTLLAEILVTLLRFY